MATELTLDGTSPDVAFTLLRGDRAVAEGSSTIRVAVSTGFYSVVARSQHSEWEHRQEILVEGATAHILVRAPTKASLIPIPGHTTKRFESHVEGLWGSIWTVPTDRRSGGLVVMHRQVAELSDPMPLQPLALEVLDPECRSVQKFRSPTAASRDMAIWTARVAPGSYTVRLSGTAQLVPVMTGRITVVIVPAVDDCTTPAQAAIFTVPAVGESDETLDVDALLQAENLFGFLRVGRPISTTWLLERTRSHPDPMVQMISASQLLAGREAESPEVESIWSRLDSQVPTNPELMAQLRATGVPGTALVYPPMLLGTYRRLRSDSEAEAIGRGSYAEHAAAALCGTGLWFAWVDADHLSAPPASPEVPLLENVAAAVIADDSAPDIRCVVVGRFAATLRRLGVLPGVSGRLSSRVAGWRSAPLLQVETLKIREFAHLHAQLNSSTPAYALIRTDQKTLLRLISGATRVTSTVHDELAKRLEAPMSTDATASSKKDSADGTSGDAAKTLSGASLWAAVVVLAAFGVLVIWMLSTADSEADEVWQRQVYIYGSVEAIVFAAAGALFGVQVKREQVAKAEQRAAESDAEATEAKKSERLASTEAERGRAQAAAIRGMAAAAGGAVPGQDFTEDIPRAAGGSTTRGAGLDSAAALSALRHVANELFPPAGGGA